MEYAHKNQHTAKAHGGNQEAIHFRPEEKAFPDMEKRSR
jgi:hypothetical protein